MKQLFQNFHFDQILNLNPHNYTTKFFKSINISCNHIELFYLDNIFQLHVFPVAFVKQKYGYSFWFKNLRDVKSLIKIFSKRIFQLFLILTLRKLWLHVRFFRNQKAFTNYMLKMKTYFQKKQAYTQNNIQYLDIKYIQNEDWQKHFRKLFVKNKTIYITLT